MIDSHAHLTSDALWDDIDAILLGAQEAGITSIVNICTDEVTLKRGLELHQRYPWVYNAAATTPHDAVQQGKSVFPIMEKAAREGSLVAVGETGLEYYYYNETKEEQKALFKRYLHLASECNLPVVIHCRDAFKDFFEIIDAEYVGAPGVLHCFTGSLQDAADVIERGWYLSLSGIVTFKRSEELREVAKLVPIDQLLIETDSPYLAPQSKRGKQNEPAFLLETAKLIASMKGISIEELSLKTSENTKSLFNF